MRRCTDVLKPRGARMPRALPLPSKSATYQLGATRLVIESTDDQWLEYLERRYGRFPAESSGPEFTIRFECTSERVPDGMTSPLANYAEAHEIESRPDGFFVRTPTVTAEVDLRSRRATLRGPRAAYPLDNLLRHLLPALSEQGIVFHGAALEGVVACGPSGAGKSTLASLSGEHALCDELCAVRRDERGHFRVTSLPFWTARPGSSALSAMLLLRHGHEHRLTRLTEGDALRRLSTETLWPVGLPSAMERALEHVSRLVQSVPAFELAFTKDESAWEYIEENVLR